MKNNIILFGFLSVLLASGTAHAQTPSEATVRASLKRVLNNPMKATAVDMKNIVEFAEKSDKVTVQIIKGLAADGAGKGDPVLLGYYVAGAIQYDLDHPKQAKDAYADKLPAVKAALLAYRQLKAKNVNYTQALMEKLSALDKKGQLPAYVRSMVSASGKK